MHKCHQCRHNENGHQDVHPNASKDKYGKGDASEDSKDDKDGAVIHGAAEQNDGAVAEEQCGKDDEGNRFLEEVEEDNEEHAELAEVALHAKSGFAEGVVMREGVEREKPLPWTTPGKIGGSNGGWTLVLGIMSEENAMSDSG
ncbi:hypothetical protein VNO78_25202 [Psophocarpus tetragonolobus]|uniref:Uncharacterized protein n=1 Tax=Psophocarpus tetragonolobus TaxID=3891 RepID=A0AAN9S5J2_PSOTE